MTDEKVEVTPESWATGIIKAWDDFFSPALTHIQARTGLTRDQATTLILINQLSQIIRNLGWWVEDGRQHWKEGERQREIALEYTELGLRYMKHELKEDDEWRGENHD